MNYQQHIQKGMGVCQTKYQCPWCGFHQIADRLYGSAGQASKARSKVTQHIKEKHMQEVAAANDRLAKEALLHDW